MVARNCAKNDAFLCNNNNYYYYLRRVNAREGGRSGTVTVRVRARTADPRQISTDRFIL